MKSWETFLTDRDRVVFGRSGHGGHAGFGKRPALLVIDVNYAFCGDKDEPIEESVKRWRNSCGADGWRTLPTIAELIKASRKKRIPVIYTTGGVRKDGWDRGAWGWKNTRATDSIIQEKVDGYEIMPQVAPLPQDLVVRKLKPSAFFATPLMSYLNQLQVDTLIMTGSTTSGCVRASVIDAFSYNFRVTVVADACFDRYQSSHAINLFDMNAKYADVVESADALKYLKDLPAGLFALPTG
jgi:maleamate amidohydrolase